MSNWAFEFSYQSLDPFFFRRVDPEKAPEPKMLLFNEALAAELGLSRGEWAPEEKARELSGSVLPAGAKAIAQAYAGHQFGHFNMLGDGRALLLGEMRLKSGELVDVQLKGSGRTPFSRGGDGLAALGPMLREYLMSEALAGLGVPTNRALAVVATGRPVYREKVHAGAVLTRVAASHLRAGTFEYARAFGDLSKLRMITDYAIDRHFPEAKTETNPVASFLAGVAKAQGTLIALWQHVGFVHGVMNTDNMSIAGQTIDFGPCAFMDHYSADTVFSSIDTWGRYAFGKQPEMALWNLERLAVCLLPLLSEDAEEAHERANESLETFASTFRFTWRERMRERLGLLRSLDADEELMMDWVHLLDEHAPDYTLCMRALLHVLAPKPEARLPLPGPFQHVAGFFERDDVKRWLARWHSRLAAESTDAEDRLAVMKGSSPAVVPRNHLVEAILEKGCAGDLEPIHAFLELFRDPYATRAEASEWAKPPPSGQPPHRTTCGT